MSEIPSDFFTLDDFDLKGKVVFLRVDINSPIHPVTKEVIGVSRFKSHIETINDLRNTKLVIIAHQSRPGKDDFTSLRDHSNQLRKIIGREVKFVDALFGEGVEKAIKGMSPGDILMLENSRFYSEEANLGTTDIEIMESTNLVQKLLPLIDYYVVDAFPAIHREQTTLVGFRRLLPNIAGRLIEREIRMIDKFRLGKEHPKIAILAGSKIEDSIQVSKSFLENSTVDTIITGGVVANAFLWANGINIGQKNKDFIAKNNKKHEDLIAICKDLLSKFGDRIRMPVDAILNPSGRRIGINDKIPDDEIMADIGLDTVVYYTNLIRDAKAIFMNGPMGMYEMDQFSVGTREILNYVANSNSLKIAGGGHTLSALEKLDLLNTIDHASTGGGSLISYLSGEPMPVLEALKESKQLFKGKEYGRRTA